MHSRGCRDVVARRTGIRVISVAKRRPAHLPNRQQKPKKGNNGPQAQPRRGGGAANQRPRHGYRKHNRRIGLRLYDWRPCKLGALIATAATCAVFWAALVRGAVGPAAACPPGFLGRKVIRRQHASGHEIPRDIFGAVISQYGRPELSRMASKEATHSRRPSFYSNRGDRPPPRPADR